VAECALTRRVFEAAAAVQRKALDARAGAGDLLVEAQKLVEVATHRATTAQTVALSDVVDLELDRMQTDVDATVRPTGLGALDRKLLGGPREGDLIIPGGRPSAGKTALGVQIAHTMADAGWPVLFFSLEMPRLSVLQRVVAQRAGIDLGLIRARAFTTIDDTNAYLQAVDAVRRLPLHLVDDSGSVGFVASPFAGGGSGLKSGASASGRSGIWKRRSSSGVSTPCRCRASTDVPTKLAVWPACTLAMGSSVTYFRRGARLRSPKFTSAQSPSTLAR
jgi:hypothetical protein